MKEQPISWLKPKNDFIFKLIFGSNNVQSKELLIAFLNDFLHVPENQSFASIELLNPFTEQHSIEDKLSIFDIKARIIGYGYVNIEIQLTNQKNIHKRSLYYSSKLYEEQLIKGDDYYQLTRVITINLLDFVFFNTSLYASCYRLVEEKTAETFPDLMQLHFIEFPKFIQQEQLGTSQSHDRRAKWLRFLTNEDEMEWNEMAKNDPMIGKAVDILRTASLDPITRMQYEAREKALKDIASVHGDGKREGKLEGKLEIAKKMLRKGMNIQLIVEMTELPYDEVAKLQSELNH